MKPLIHIVYVSFSSKPLSNQELNELLTTIRKKNSANEITGLLLYNNSTFIQVIEGAEETLHRVFEKIRKDVRHTNVVILMEEPIQQRTFPGWYMGFQQIEENQTRDIKGFSDFMNDSDSSLLKGSTEEVMDLLTSFKKYT
ncbi:MAG: BLUF domain-containing protein [Bacteroidota bacterium]